MAGLYDDTPGLSDGTGLWRGRLGLFSGASGLINGSGGAYIDLYFSRGAYSVAGSGYTTLTSIPGFTFTRASLAMGYDATGKLTYGPNNLLSQSQTFGNALWVPTGASIASDTTTAPDGTLTADTLIEDTSGSAHRLLPALGNLMSFGIGAGMVASLYVKSAGRSHAFIRINNSGGDIAAGNVRLADGVVTQTSIGTISAQVMANGWVRIAAYGVSASPAPNTSAEVRCSNSDIYANYTGDGTSGLHIWGFQLEAVTYQTTPSTYYPTTTAAYYGPRLVYDPVTLASQGILVEEARTNLALQSQTFDNASWTKISSVVTANAVTSPDGTTNADLMVDDATNADHKVRQGIAVTSGTAYTFSVYAKAGTLNYVWLYAGTPNVGKAFDLAAGTVLGNVGGAPTSATITAVGNGWYRCEMTYTAGATSTQNQDIGTSQNGTTFNYVGTGQGVYLWQAQLEAGTGASSPIPTTTAAVTRAAEDVVLTGLTVPDGCTVAFEGLVPAFVSTDARLSLSDGSTNNRMSAVNTSGNLNALVVAASSGTTVLSVGGAPSAAFKMAISSVGGVYSASTNGSVATAGSGPANSTLTQIDVGKNSGSSIRYWNSPIARIRVWKSVKPVQPLSA